MPPLAEIAYDDYGAADESDVSSDVGSAEGQPPISLKPTKFSLKAFAARIGQANYSACIKWKKVLVAMVVEKKHRSMIRGENDLEQLRDGPPHWVTAVADFLVTFKDWLQLEIFDNAEWIGRQWVEMFCNKCATTIEEARNVATRGKQQPVTDLGECVSNMVKRNGPELPNTNVTVVICWVSNGKDMILAPTQLRASYTNVGQWEELIGFSDKKGGLKELYVHTLMFKCTLAQEELDKGYMGSYSHGHMIIDPIYGQMSYNCCLSNAFKMNLGYNLKILLVKMKRATRQVIARHLIRPVEVIPASHVNARCAQLLIILHRLWKVLKRVEEMCERMMVGKRMMLVLM